MKIKNPFLLLNKFEMALWLSSVFVVILSYVLSGFEGTANTICSIIGVTALIFVAKGHVLGMVLCIIFAAFYGLISLHFRYYGELITYVGMTLPMDVFALVSWIKNPYKDTHEVKVAKMTHGQMVFMWVAAIVVRAIFYFLLGALSTPNLVFSTVSVTTSFLAVALTYFRSPYYALAYAANDVVLIVLWTLACFEDLSYVPMVMCFVMFLANDLYGLYNWKKMQKRQTE
ncbi:MAG: nicotinamide mononucleotide transporter [Clostridia bacterium]|nr:nicotinamide mononucleotide transporter [Clostridia bacterium]